MSYEISKSVSPIGIGNTYGNWRVKRDFLCMSRCQRYRWVGLSSGSRQGGMDDRRCIVDRFIHSSIHPLPSSPADRIPALICCPNISHPLSSSVHSSPQGLAQEIIFHNWGLHAAGTFILNYQAHYPKTATVEKPSSCEWVSDMVGLGRASNNAPRLTKVGNLSVFLNPRLDLQEWSVNSVDLMWRFFITDGRIRLFHVSLLLCNL